MPHVFLSHHSADKPVVEEFAHRLTKERVEPWTNGRGDGSCKLRGDSPQVDHWVELINKVCRAPWRMG